jgi:predicted small lipoprotein YifL
MTSPRSPALLCSHPFGEDFVRPRRSTGLFRLAIAVTLAAALGACGRKGELDLPPSAAAPPPEQPATGTGLLTPPLGTGAPAQPQPGPTNRPFVLDPLLN